MQITLKCTSPHWRADLATLLAADNEVVLSSFNLSAHGQFSLDLARNHKLHFVYDPDTCTALITRRWPEAAPFKKP
jgi:hypothetical protein